MADSLEYRTFMAENRSMKFMKNMRPLIFISNDDGYQAKGIAALIEAVRPLGDLLVVAPDGPRSGASGSITSQTPLNVDLLYQESGFMMYKCNGTPVDCVKLGLHAYASGVPDIVLGGINHGDNSSVNVHYSGTMGVVIEGCLKGIPSIGFSLCNHHADADFTPTLSVIRQLTQHVLEKGLSGGVCLNVNFPDIPAYRGVRVCRQTQGVWVNEYVGRAHPRGGTYYWMMGEYRNEEVGVEGTDHWALDNGYVAVTPTQIDVTAYQEMERLTDLNTTL